MRPIALLLAVPATLLACRPPARGSETTAPPSIELFGAESFEFREGALRAHGRASHVYYRRDTGDAWAENPEVDFPDRRTSGRPSGQVHLRAPHAHGNPFAQEVEADGTVRLSADNGEQGLTERAAYHGRQALASGDRPVHLWAAAFDLEAPGFRLDTFHDLLDLGPARLVARGAP